VLSADEKLRYFAIITVHTLYLQSYGDRMTVNSRKCIHILTVCTGNICRSPMAEGILKKLLKDHNSITVSSAGTHALEGNHASEFSLIAAYEHGIDISSHRSRHLDRKLVRNSSMILCMEPSQVEWVLSLEPSVYDAVHNIADFSGNKGLLQISDPYGSGLWEYRECFSDISSCLHNFVSSHLPRTG
jgi:protein-tyrosine phosphatase